MIWNKSLKIIREIKTVILFSKSFCMYNRDFFNICFGAALIPVYVIKYNVP
jgi:hypothetical protein